MTTPTDEQMIERVAHTLLVTLGDLGQAGATNTLKATEHSGDCTKDAWTCLFCQAYEYREAARAVIAEIQAIEREATMPPQPELPANWWLAYDLRPNDSGNGWVLVRRVPWTTGASGT